MVKRAGEKRKFCRFLSTKGEKKGRKYGKGKMQKRETAENLFFYENSIT